MNLKKKCKVVMLSTEKAVRLFLSDDKESMSNMLYDVESSNGVNLYILSDEEIKEGDTWMYIDLSGQALFPKNTNEYDDLDKKIIATTDKSLNLSEPSSAFIQKFIEEWNKGNKITEVMVEYEEKIESACTCDTIEKLSNCIHACGLDECRKRFSDGQFWHKWEELKVDKNNYITITKVKDSWSKEEIITLLNEMSPKYKELEDFNSNWDDVSKIEWGIQKAYNHDYLVIQRIITERL